MSCARSVTRKFFGHLHGRLVLCLSSILLKTWLAQMRLAKPMKPCVRAHAEGLGRKNYGTIRITRQIREERRT